MFLIGLFRLSNAAIRSPFPLPAHPHLYLLPQLRARTLQSQWHCQGPLLLWPVQWAVTTGQWVWAVPDWPIPVWWAGLCYLIRLSVNKPWIRPAFGLTAIALHTGQPHRNPELPIQNHLMVNVGHNRIGPREIRCLPNANPHWIWVMPIS